MSGCQAYTGYLRFREGLSASQIDQTGMKSR